MAESTRSRRARALSGVVAAVGVLLAVVGLVLAWEGNSPPVASDRPGADRAVVTVPRDPSPVAATTPVAEPGRGVRPEVVVVPALGVRAAVLPIRTEAGALTPPSDPQELGWWSGGSRPGDATGAAVLTGHTVHTGGGALDDLEDLVAGDRVVVESAADQVAYAVTSVQVMAREDLAARSTEIFARSGPGRLVLITCEDWDGTAYRSNVVVTARPTAG